jgi:hypothetical protein
MTETKMPVRSVRTAVSTDEEELMVMCRMLHEENGLFPMSEDRVRRVLRMAFDGLGGVLGVIGNPGKIEAMIYMLISQIWHSDEWHLDELFSYCRPEYRKSNNAKRLIQFAKDCSDELHLPLVIGIISNTRTEEKIRLYQRQLSKPNGCFFVYNTKWNGSDKAQVDAKTN